MTIKPTYGFAFAALILGFGMVCMSVSRYYAYQAEKNIVFEEYIKADNDLGRALSWLPVKAEIPPFNFDLQRIHYLWGEGFLSEAKEQNFSLLEKAREHFLKAVALNPYDIKSAKGLAETTFLLEKGLHLLNPEKENTYNALPFYQTLLKLRPAGITVHYMIARYYYFKGMEEALAGAVSQIAFLCPGDAVNGQLQKEEFYSSQLDQAVVQGVSKAIAEKKSLRTACLAMARLVEKEGDFSRALEYQQRGMAITAYRNSMWDYIHLGRLLLETGDNKAAFSAFENALVESDNFNNSFNRIYDTFHRLGADKAFLEFGGSLGSDRKKLPGVVTLQMARTRIDLGLYEPAGKDLIRMIAANPDPEAYYLLAVIAEKQAMWDDMELNIQKAAVLNPDECKYYSKFAQALYKQGKNTQAKFQQEKAAACKASNKK